MRTTSYKSLEAQIRKLEKQREALRLKRRTPVIASIVKSMREFEITVEELTTALNKGTRANGRAKGGPGSSKASKPVAPKYRDPESGATWSGRGKPPRWLADAQARGASREQFLIVQ